MCELSIDEMIILQVFIRYLYVVEYECIFFFFKLIKKRFLKTKFNDILNLFLLVRILFRTLSTSIQLI